MKLAGTSEKPLQFGGSQPTLVSMAEKRRQLQCNGSKWQDITDSGTRCIGKDMMPLNVL